MSRQLSGYQRLYGPKSIPKSIPKTHGWVSRGLGLGLLLISITALSGCGATTQGATTQGATTQIDEAAKRSAAGGSNVADYLISNVTVIDATTGVRENHDVYVSGDKIVRVQPTASKSSLAATTISSSTRAPTATANWTTANWTIDGAGKYLIPGLWDMHVHITYEPELTRAMPALFLSYGITSVRDTGGLLPKLLPEVARWRAPDANAPRIFFSGPLLDGSTVVYDGKAVPEIGTPNATPDSARANIARLKAAGVDFVKTYELITPEVFEALTQAAREAELPIASHVPLMMAARDAGPLVDSMEHLRNIELDCASNARQLLEQRSKSIAAPGDEPGIKLRGSIHADQRPIALANYDQDECNRVIEALKNTIQVPTLRLNTSALYQPYDRDDWQTEVKRLPANSQKRWLDNGKQWSDRRPSLPTDTGKFSLSLVGQLHRAGVPIGAGTDTPIGSALPGYSLHTELERLVEAGLSPMEALGAATIAPAQFLRKQDQMGQIASGFAADLVLLNKNPLDDIRHSRSINTVISKGRVAYTAD